MKKFFFFLLASLLLASCATAYKPVDRTVSVNFLDFRPYLNSGFFISPDSCPDEFEPIGELSIVVYPADIARPVNTGKSLTKMMDGVYDKSGLSTSTYTKEDISSEELLRLIVDEAISVGADGLSDLKMSASYETHTTKYSTWTTISHYEISGVGIKKK